MNEGPEKPAHASGEAQTLQISHSACMLEHGDAAEVEMAEGWTGTVCNDRCDVLADERFGLLCRSRHVWHRFVVDRVAVVAEVSCHTDFGILGYREFVLHQDMPCLVKNATGDFRELAAQMGGAYASRLDHCGGLNLTVSIRACR